MAHVNEEKKKVVAQLTQLLKESPIIGVANLESLPAQQLQQMRADLRETVTLLMTKKTLMKIAIEAVKGEKKDLEKLEEYLKYGMPALVFTKDSPFKLTKTLKKSKTPAPAKAGQVAPKDIIVPAGPTQYPPGPVISELSSIGLDVGVENGKVAVKVDSTVCEKGEKISQKIAEVLTRLEIKPMEVGLDLLGAWEDGVIYDKDVLDVDEQVYLDKLSKAAYESFNLSIETAWTTKDNAEVLITKAFTSAKGVGLEAGVMEPELVEEVLAKAERGMLGLKDEANIDLSAPDPAAEEKKEEPKAEEKPAEEPKAEEKPAEAPAEEKKEEAPAPEKKEEKEEKKEEPKPEPKEEPKQDPAPEVKKEEVKVEKAEKPAETEEKKEAPKEVPKEEVKEEPKQEAPAAPAKEEKPAEAPKEQSSEEKEKQAAEQKEVEDLTKELVKKGTLRK